MGTTRPFRFGVINEQMSTAEAWTEQARWVEDAGYDTFLMRDHFVPDFFGEQFAPLVALAVAASVTSRLRLGTLVIDNDYRHPVMLAKEAATLDLLSGGRLELGIGAGWLRSEYDQAGIAYDDNATRVDRLEEGVALLKGLWRGEPVDHAGQHYQVSGLTLFPRPAQQPRPPLLIGGGRRRMLAFAGREADIVGILTTSVATGTVVDDPRSRLSAVVARQIGWIREGAGERFAGIELSCVADVVVTDQRRAATEAMIAARGWSGITVEEVWDMPAIVIGSIDGIVEQLHERRNRLGLSYFVVSSEIQASVAPIVARLAGR